MTKEVTDYELKAPSVCLCSEHLAIMADTLSNEEIGEVVVALFRSLILGDDTIDIESERAYDAFLYTYPFSSRALKNYLNGKSGGRGNKKNYGDIDPKTDKIVYKQKSSKRRLDE